MTAIAFVLADLRTGHRLGHALICPDARYVSVLPTGAPRIDRRFAAPAEWRSILAETADTLPPGPMPVDSAIVRVLLDEERRRSITVQWLTTLPIDAAPTSVLDQLDNWLRELGLGKDSPA